MDALLKTILFMLKEEAIKVGSDLIERGIQLVTDRIQGRASDEQIMQWLRDVQKGSINENNPSS